MTTEITYLIFIVIGAVVVMYDLQNRKSQPIHKDGTPKRSDNDRHFKFFFKIVFTLGL